MTYPVDSVVNLANNPGLICTLTWIGDILLMLNCVVSVGADINSRDHSGKKPKQVARDGLTIEAQGT